MLVGARREPAADERRVALTPNVVSDVEALGHSVVVEARAGEAAGFPDAAYEDAGAKIVRDITAADLVVLVGPPSATDLQAMQKRTAVLGLLTPFTDKDVVRALSDQGMSALAFEALPRTTLAQTMDALSSQATVTGYAAVLAGAVASPRFLPMLTTAAGTVRPSRVLVLGAGVAGLQAIATARRLGGIVSAYDIRPEAREQVESLGARFVEAPTGESDASGYAIQADAELQRRQLQALAGAVAESEVVVATALIPGRPAPLLISADMVGAMRPGAVIVDAAAVAGGNCELTRPGETVTHKGVAILGPRNLPATVASDASRMYARNVVALLAHMTRAGDVVFDFDDEIIDNACVVRDGYVRHSLARRIAGLEEA